VGSRQFVNPVFTVQANCLLPSAYCILIFKSQIYLGNGGSLRVLA
jgi:hypothetical protein